MSDETANQEEEKITPRTELKRLPEWFQQQYGPGGRVLPPLEDDEVKPIRLDPRRIGPAAQQEKKPL